MAKDTDATNEHRWCMSSFLFNVPPESVDEDAGVIRGAAIVTEGEARGHDVWLDSEFINETVKQGNARKQGLKVRFGHPTMSSTALGTFLGRAKHFRTDGVIARADIFLSNEAKDAPQGDLYTYTLGMAQNESDMFGTSIVFTPGAEYRRNNKGEKVFPPGYDGDRETRERQRDAWNKAGPKTYATCAELMASDLVDDPAANSGLFSAWNSGTLAQQVSEFLDTHAEVMDLIDRDPSVIDLFTDRYRKYAERKHESPSEDNPMPEPQEPTPVVVATAAELTAGAVTEPENTATTVTLAAPAEPVTVDPDRTIPITELEAMVTEVGAETACEVLLNGGGMEDARALMMKRLAEENEQLRAQIATRADTETTGEDPAEFSDGEPADPDPAATAEARETLITQYAMSHGLTPGQARFAMDAEEQRNAKASK